MIRRLRYFVVVVCCDWIYKNNAFVSNVVIAHYCLQWKVAHLTMYIHASTSHCCLVWFWRTVTIIRCWYVVMDSRAVGWNRTPLLENKLTGGCIHQTNIFWWWVGICCNVITVKPPIVDWILWDRDRPLYKGHRKKLFTLPPRRGQPLYKGLNKCIIIFMVPNVSLLQRFHRITSDSIELPAVIVKFNEPISGVLPLLSWEQPMVLPEVAREFYKELTDIQVYM